MTVDPVTQQPIDKTTLPSTVFRRWIHSREEDITGVEVYRPEGFRFPPSFGRDAFEIRADGRFTQIDVGPADGTVTSAGHWRQVAPRQLQVRFTDAHPGFTFSILQVDETVLRIHRLSKHPEPSTVDGTPEPRVVAFDTARVVTDRVLEVTGTKPFVNLRVDLVPVVYVRQPDFWEIEVVGSLPGIGLPPAVPYTVSMPLGAAMGRCGIEVVGANQRKRFDLFCGLEDK
jgi:hypothetical protein